MGADRGLYARDRACDALHRAVVAAVAARLGPLGELTSRWVPWFSATFEGVRHELSFSQRDGLNFTELCADGDLELATADHVVVSIGAELLEGRTTLHILTIANA